MKETSTLQFSEIPDDIDFDKLNEDIAKINQGLEGNINLAKSNIDSQKNSLSKFDQFKNSYYIKNFFSEYLYPKNRDGSINIRLQNLRVKEIISKFRPNVNIVALYPKEQSLDILLENLLKAGIEIDLILIYALSLSEEITLIKIISKLADNKISLQRSLPDLASELKNYKLSNDDYPIEFCYSHLREYLFSKKTDSNTTPPKQNKTNSQNNSGNSNSYTITNLKIRATELKLKKLELIREANKYSRSFCKNINIQDKYEEITEKNCSRIKAELDELEESLNKLSKEFAAIERSVQQALEDYLATKQLVLEKQITELKNVKFNLSHKQFELLDFTIYNLFQEELAILPSVLLAKQPIPSFIDKLFTITIIDLNLIIRKIKDKDVDPAIILTKLVEKGFSLNQAILSLVNNGIKLKSIITHLSADEEQTIIASLTNISSNQKNFNTHNEEITNWLATRRTSTDIDSESEQLINLLVNWLTEKPEENKTPEVQIHELSIYHFLTRSDHEHIFNANSYHFMITSPQRHIFQGPRQILFDYLEATAKKSTSEIYDPNEFAYNFLLNLLPCLIIHIQVNLALFYYNYHLHIKISHLLKQYHANLSEADYHKFCYLLKELQDYYNEISEMFKFKDEYLSADTVTSDAINDLLNSYTSVEDRINSVSNGTYETIFTLLYSVQWQQILTQDTNNLTITVLDIINTELESIRKDTAIYFTIKELHQRFYTDFFEKLGISRTIAKNLLIPSRANTLPIENPVSANEQTISKSQSAKLQIIMTYTTKLKKTISYFTEIVTSVYKTFEPMIVACETLQSAIIIGMLTKIETRVQTLGSNNAVASLTQRDIILVMTQLLDLQISIDTEVQTKPSTQKDISVISEMNLGQLIAKINKKSSIGQRAISNFIEYIKNSDEIFSDESLSCDIITFVYPKIIEIISIFFKIISHFKKSLEYIYEQFKDMANTCTEIENEDIFNLFYTLTSELNKASSCTTDLATLLPHYAKKIMIECHNSENPFFANIKSLTEAMQVCEKISSEITKAIQAYNSQISSDDENVINFLNIISTSIDLQLPRIIEESSNFIFNNSYHSENTSYTNTHDAIIQFNQSNKGIKQETTRVETQPPFVLDALTKLHFQSGANTSSTVTSKTPMRNSSNSLAELNSTVETTIEEQTSPKNN